MRKRKSRTDEEDDVRELTAADFPAMKSRDHVPELAALAGALLLVSDRPRNLRRKPPSGGSAQGGFSGSWTLMVVPKQTMWFRGR
jgi:hypothetical protein